MQKLGWYFLHFKKNRGREYYFLYIFYFSSLQWKVQPAKHIRTYGSRNSDAMPLHCMLKIHSIDGIHTEASSSSIQTCQPRRARRRSTATELEARAKSRVREVTSSGWRLASMAGGRAVSISRPQPRRARLKAVPWRQGHRSAPFHRARWFLSPGSSHYALLDLGYGCFFFSY
jgi:hypothetical protein